MPFNLLFFKKRRSSKKKELEKNLQRRVECVEKRVQCLEGKLDEVMEAIRYGGRTQRKQETKEIQDFEDYEVNVNREDVKEEREQTCKDDSVGDGVYIVVNVDVHREDVKEEEEELEQIGKEETVLGCVEVVNGQEDKLEQTGEAESAEETVLDCVEVVNGQDKLEQTGEAECAEETVLAHEDLQEDSDMVSETTQQCKFSRGIRRIWHKFKFTPRIRRICSCFVLCLDFVLVFAKCVIVCMEMGCV
jgi:hypothetical protein